MKIRTGFVSNSSSSSFIIQKKNLTDDQIHKIYNHIEFSKTLTKYDESLKEEFSCISDWDSWTIVENDERIIGRTMMDNFNMYKYLELLCIEDKDIEWDDYY